MISIVINNMYSYEQPQLLLIILMLLENDVQILVSTIVERYELE